MIDLNFKYKNLIDEIRNQAPFVPEFAIILGSGLGNFAERVDLIKTISTSTLPDYPKSTIQGQWLNSMQREGPYLALTCTSNPVKAGECSNTQFAQVLHGCRQLVS